MAPREHEARGPILKFFCLFFLVLGNAFAQDFGSLFRPGPSKRNISFEEILYAPTKVHQSRDELELRNWRLRANAPVWSDGAQEVTVGAEAGDLVMHHENPLLKNYRTLQGNIGWRRYVEKNRVRSVSVSFGSSSDAPFARERNSVASANYLHQTSEKWWFAVNWSNNRNFANGIPIPGFFYVAKASREENLILGLPFVFWRKRFGNGFNTQMTSFFPWNHQAEAGYFWKPTTGASIGFEHRPQQFLRDDRQSKRDRFFFVEQRAYVVVQGTAIPSVLQWRLEAGRAFNRRVFEARNFSQKDKRFNINFEDANFLALQVTSSF